MNDLVMFERFWTSLLLQAVVPVILPELKSREILTMCCQTEVEFFHKIISDTNDDDLVLIGLQLNLSLSRLYTMHVRTYRQ